jgi:hypothetical protein
MAANILRKLPIGCILLNRQGINNMLSFPLSDDLRFSGALRDLDNRNDDEFVRINESECDMPRKIEKDFYEL